MTDVGLSTTSPFCSLSIYSVCEITSVFVTTCKYWTFVIAGSWLNLHQDFKNYTQVKKEMLPWNELSCKQHSEKLTMETFVTTHCVNSWIHLEKVLKFIWRFLHGYLRLKERYLVFTMTCFSFDFCISFDQFGLSGAPDDYLTLGQRSHPCTKIFSRGLATIVYKCKWSTSTDQKSYTKY